MDFSKIIQDTSDQLRQEATQEALADDVPGMTAYGHTMRASSLEALEVGDSIARIHNMLQVTLAQAMGEEAKRLRKVLSDDHNAINTVARMAAVVFAATPVAGTGCQQSQEYVETFESCVRKLHHALHHGTTGTDTERMVDALAQIIAAMGDCAAYNFPRTPGK